MTSQWNDRIVCLAQVAVYEMLSIQGNAYALSIFVLPRTGQSARPVSHRTKHVYTYMLYYMYNVLLNCNPAQTVSQTAHANRK